MNIKFGILDTKNISHQISDVKYPRIISSSKCKPQDIFFFGGGGGILLTPIFAPERYLNEGGKLINLM